MFVQICYAVSVESLLDRRLVQRLSRQTEVDRLQEHKVPENERAEVDTCETDIKFFNLLLMINKFGHKNAIKNEKKLSP